MKNFQVDNGNQTCVIRKGDQTAIGNQKIKAATKTSAAVVARKLIDFHF